MKRHLIFIFCLAVCSLAHAQVPGTLSYQGILVNVAGNPVADGNHTVTFNFHKTATGGVPTFARGPFTVSTFKGLFTLVLGTGTPATVNEPLPVLASDPNYIGNTQYYLELVADNVILSPRVSLSSMPYAFTAQNANTMNASGLTGTVSDARLEPKVDVTELTVGSSAQLAVSATGNITKINNVAISFPAAQGAANSLLTNDGTGTLSWTTVSDTALDPDLLDLADGSLTGSKVGTGIDASNLTTGSLSLAGGKFSVDGVSGNISKINNVATSFPAAQGAANTLLSNDGSGNLTWVSPATSTTGWGLTGNSGTTAGTNFIGTTDAKDLVFTTNNVERARLTSAGNLGIGITSPYAPLQVAGSIVVGDGANSQLVWNMELISTKTSPISNRINFGTDGTGYKFTIGKNQLGTVSDLLTIQDNGNIGIGTTNALGKLDVFGGPIAFGGTLNNTSSRPGVSSAPINNEIWAYNSGVSTADDGFMRISAGGGTSGLTKSFIDLSGYSQVPDMNSSITFGTAGAEKMRIDISGNVGIGTNIPASKLDVAGDVRLAQTTAPTTTTDKLYNVGGYLYWSGVTISNGNTGTNHFFGYGAGLSNTTGNNNHFEGYSAGPSNTTGSFNYFSGDGAGNNNTTASGNHFSGIYTGFNNTTGANNYFSGYNAGNANTTGSENHFEGRGAGQANTTASGNHFEGYLAGRSNTTGAANLFIGSQAGRENITASANHFVGEYSGLVNTTGERNYFSGHATGSANTTASENHFEGYTAGYFNTTGTANYFSGYQAGLSNTTTSNLHFEGYQAGKSNTTGATNHFSGWKAGTSNTTGGANFFVGNNAGTANTTGGENHFEGLNAGAVNTTGSLNYFSGNGAGYNNTTANANHFVGWHAGIVNTTGTRNYFSGYEAGTTNTTSSELHFDGYQAGGQNTTGTLNHFSGYQAGTANTTGFQNTAVGYKALTLNIGGQNNTAIGKESLKSNTSGNFNVAIGSSALTLNVSGTDNTAVGVDALNQTTGNNNTAIGRAALGANTSGASNSALGNVAGSTVTTGSNLTLIGYNAQPTSASANNEITFGNSSVTTLRANVTSITSLSDRRDKKNITDLSLGLDFLLQLRPRQFNWDKREWYSTGQPDESKIERNLTAGFIAQELDQTQTDQNAEWLNLVLKNNPEKWEATYGNLLPVMVKAIQEQQQTIDSQKEQILLLEQKLEKLNGGLAAELDAIKKQLGMEVKAETNSSATGGNK
jgi:Chaperone of endosialidase